MSVWPAEPAAPRPRGRLTEGERQWLYALRQSFCPSSEEWKYWERDMIAKYGGLPDDYRPYVAYLNESWQEMLPCENEGPTPRPPDNGPTPREPVRRGTGPPMPPAFSDWPSPRGVIPQRPYLASSTSSARLRGVLLAGQAQRRKAAATGTLQAPLPLINMYVAFYVEVPGEEKPKVTSVDVTLRKHTTETGATEFYLEMLPRTFKKIEAALTNILNPKGRLTRHTLVYIGDDKRLPASDKIVATRSSIKDDWNILDMATRIKEYAETYAKNPANDRTLRIQVQCPCPTN